MVERLTTGAVLMDDPSYRVIVNDDFIDIVLHGPVDATTVEPLRELLSAARDAGLDVRVRMASRAERVRALTDHPCRRQDDRE